MTPKTVRSRAPVSHASLPLPVKPKTAMTGTVTRGKTPTWQAVFVTMDRIPFIAEGARSSRVYKKGDAPRITFFFIIHVLFRP